MNRTLKRAIQQWNDEVETLAALLIQQGWPPLDAADEARRRVSAKRAWAAQIGEIAYQREKDNDLG